MYGAMVSLVMPSARTRDNGHKLEHPLNIRKNFCDVQMMEHWNFLSRVVMESP